MIRSLKRLWLVIESNRRWQFVLLLILMLLSSIAEVSTIGMVVPFLGMLLAPERLFENAYLLQILSYFRISHLDNFFLPVTTFFVFVVAFAGSIRLLLIWFSTRISYSVGNELSVKIFTGALYQPYSVHCNRNSSEIVSAITSKTNIMIGQINMILTLMSSALITAFIFVTLTFIDPIIATYVFFGFGTIYLVILQATKIRLSKNSHVQSHETNKCIKILQEGLGGIREVITGNLQAKYCSLFRTSDLALRKAQGSNAFLQSSPRFAVEALGMIFLVVLAYFVAKRGNIAEFLPVLGAFAVGAQRLLPMLQQIYASFSSVLGSIAPFNDALDLLEQKIDIPASVSENKPKKDFEKLELENVTFNYGEESADVLTDVNLEITKGSVVGFIGETGGGKSTLLDLMMGLLVQDKGLIKVNGECLNSLNLSSWHSSICHVPQHIYLADRSIEDNIAISELSTEINRERMMIAAEQVQLTEFIAGLPDRYKTIVGENGVRLSGGQRQRIGIARALYRQCNVLILDEATSALDQQTEQAVIESLKSTAGGLTIVMVTHRLATLRFCSEVFEVKNASCNLVDLSKLKNINS